MAIRHRTQKEELRELFIRRPNQWIDLPEIILLGIAQYNARIFEIRRGIDGLNIVNKVDWKGGCKFTSFMYIPAKPKEPAAQETQQYGSRTKKRVAGWVCGQKPHPSKAI